jgi:hypothetical protein
MPLPVRYAITLFSLIACAIPQALSAQYAAPSLFAQISGQADKQPQAPSTTADLPSVKVVFSEPKIDSPLQLPSTVMGGGLPMCGPDGRSFIQFMTSPPYYNNKVVYSVSPDGKVIHYPVEQIVGLTNIYVRFIDPGVTNAVILFHAQEAGTHASEHYYMALFDYDGKLQNYSALDLGFEPVEIVQLYDDGFLVSGGDTAQGRPMFVLIDGSGTIRRDLRETPLMPSDKDLTAMLNSINIVGWNPKDMPLPQKITAVLSLFRPIHSQRGVLILEPGAGARVIEILRSGDTRIVGLKLPANQIAHSMMTNKGSWFVRAHLVGSSTEWSLFQVDPETGEALKRIDTSGVPATTISCATDSGFYGFRWIDKKPYLIYGDLK